MSYIKGKTLLYLFLLAAAVIPVCGAVVYTEDFESGGSLPAGWNFGVMGSNWAFDGSVKAAGSYSLRLALPDTNASSASTTAYSSQFQVNAGSLVRVSGYIKTAGVDDSTAKYTASIELIGNHTNELLGETFSTTSGFTYLEKTIRIGDDTTAAALYIRGYGPAGQVWFDRIRIEEIFLPAELEHGMYARWRFNGNFADSGGRSLTLTSVGSGGSPVITPNGYTAGACQFNNTVSGAAQVLFPGAIDIKDIDGVTVTAWIKPSLLLSGFTTTSPHTVARLYHSTSADDVLDFRIRDGRLDVYYKRPVANNFTNFNVPLNKWSFVAMTQQGGELTVYLNDKKQSFAVQAGSNYNRFVLGATAGTTARGINGVIDEVRLYNRALTAAQIRDVWGNADLVRDGIVDYNDFAVFTNEELSAITGSLTGDINDDGSVTEYDLILLAAQWLDTY